MDNVTRFPGTVRKEKPQAQLTSAHRFLIYRIFDLCTHIDEQTTYRATFHYAGHVHSLSVDITPPEHQAERKGGDGTHKHCWEAEVRLPPSDLAGPDTLQELGDIITALQGYLPTSGGAA